MDRYLALYQEAARMRAIDNSAISASAETRFRSEYDYADSSICGARRSSRPWSARE